MADLQEIFKDAWSHALAGVNAAEAEAEKVLTRIGFSPEDVRRHARDFGERLTAQRREIERTLDEAVRRATSRFRVPSREDLDALEKRLDAISQRVEALAREKQTP